MFREIAKKTFDKHILPHLPQKTQRDIANLRDLRDLPGDIAVDGKKAVEEMLGAVIGPFELNRLVNDRRKHLASVERSTGTTTVTVVEITDERPPDHMSPISPTKIQELAATSIITGTKIANGLRVTFTPRKASTT